MIFGLRGAGSASMLVAGLATRADAHPSNSAPFSAHHSRSAFSVAAFS